ncbi:hypothetical protein PFICI_06788 [Pestalotiopsis fici W106-1]|uniref:CCHC-type domain-containing protein n=1 Tax=Pestalotiopsis fici (strain W106-1 / CGMCC3.15140) TaxID=1229662 RepID=W3X9F3_PESFW|nr:uncharacterized protein PFICI_06788 [Pestalotiopsis fici W106-1]ETS81786.1 hypothetical protein PFICI_06788 [Pestalotiopsis fici W106-1]
MAPLGFCKTTDNEHWERLEVLQNALSRSIALHGNGQTPVTMTEQSLYSLLTAGQDDFLEITVCKVTPTFPIAAQIPTSPHVPHMSPSRPNSMFMGSMAPEMSGIRGDKGSMARFSLSDMHENKSQGERPRSRITLDTRIFLPVPDTVCGNCQRPGHTVRDCVGPVDERGEIDGCPKCNTARAHMYDDCPARDTSEDFDLIYRYRQRKPPMKSFLVWQSFLSEQYQPATWPSFIPWSARFALEQQDQAFRAHRKPEWVYYDYDRIGWPDAEAHYREIDPDSEFMVL